MSGNDPRDPGEPDTSPQSIDPRIGTTETDRDVVSDPANDDDEGQDWSSEGGATTAGPATAVPEEGASGPGAPRPEDD